MTVYFGNMNFPIYGQTSHPASCFSDVPECCVYCYQHVNSSSCTTVRTWLDRMFQLNQRRLCTVCLGSHFSKKFCHAGRKPCQYCGALKKHHESVCPENPFLTENETPEPTTEEDTNLKPEEKEAPIDDGLQETLKMLTDKGLCHKCLGRHRTETCNTWLRCQACDSGYHHKILCPKNPSSSSNAPSPTSEDGPMSPVPLPLDSSGPSLKTAADSSTPSDSSSSPSEDNTASSRCSTPSSEASDDLSVVRKSPSDNVSAKVNQGKGKCWLQNLRKRSPDTTSLPEVEKNHLFIQDYSMEYYRQMYEELLSCDNVIDNVMAASPLSTPQPVDIDIRNQCSSPSSEASADSFVVWEAPDSPVPSDCQWEDSCSPSSLYDDDGIEMDQAHVTDVKPATRSSDVSTDVPASCPFSYPTRPSNVCSKKTHLEILFSGGRIDENVARPESRSDDVSAKICSDKVHSWLQSLPKSSSESPSSSKAEKECLSSDDYLVEYYSKTYSNISKICERAEKQPQHYYYYYYCYNYYVYYFYASVYQWLATNASNYDASAGEANVAVLSQPIDNESRNRCSSPSSESSNDSLVMWRPSDSPVPSDCRWDETYSPSFDEDFDNDM